MTVGEITFDMALSSGSQLQVVDASGLQPISFTPPSPEAVDRFLFAMHEAPQDVGGAASQTVDPLRFAAASLVIDAPEAPAAPSRVADTSTPPVLPGTPSVDRPVVEPVVVEKPTVAVPAVDRPVVETVVVEKPTVVAPAVDKPVVEPVVVEKPAVVVPAVDRPVVETVVVEKPTVVVPAVDRPVVETVVVEKPTVVAPAVDKPVVETVVAEKPTVVEKPTVIAPAVDRPVVETVVVEKPAIVAPAVDKPVVETVVVETPTIVAPSVDKPVATTPVEAPVVAERVVVPVVERAGHAFTEETPRTGEHTSSDRFVARTSSFGDTPVLPGVATESVAKPSAVPVAEQQVVAQPVAERHVIDSPVVLHAVDKPVAAPAANQEIVADKVVVESPKVVPVVEKPAAIPVVERATRAFTEEVRLSAAPEAPVTKEVRLPAAPRPDAIAASSSVVTDEPAYEKTVVTDEPAYDKTVVIDLSHEAAKTATAQPATAAPQAVDVQAAAASTASARTEVVAETVGKVVDAVAAQILVTPALVKGEGEMIVRLKSDVLDGSTIRLTAESGTLSVEISPATHSAQRAVVAAAPKLETALAEHVAVFHHVRVVVKKGKNNEAV